SPEPGAACAASTPAAGPDPVEEVSPGSPSPDPSESIARRKAFLRYQNAMMPLLGREKEKQWPRGSAQYEGDLTQMHQWFDNDIWPADELDETGDRQLVQFLGLVSQTRR